MLEILKIFFKITIKRLFKVHLIVILENIFNFFNN